MKPELKEFYYSNGKIRSQEYFLNDKYHNENGPAITWYYSNEQIEDQYWYLNDILHNENGPAVIWYYKTGKIEAQLWYLNGKEYTEEEYKKYKLIKELAGLK